jgi:hypothetical protein
VFLMDLWAILLTAIVGLAGGQIGAWLQGRRDAQAQNAREGSEIERLRLQLAASREQRERELKQADTLEWRERRLAVYLKASTDVDAFMNKTDSAPSCTTPTDFSTLADLSSSLLQAMSQTLDVSANIGTEATRTAAVSLVEAAWSLNYRISSFDKHVSGIGEDSPELLGEVLRAWHSSVVPEAAEAVSLAEDRHAIDIEIDVFWSAREAWHAASRAGLGVPS